MVTQLVRSVVLLEYAETACEATAAKENAEAAGGVKPSACAAVGCRTKPGEVVVVVLRRGS
jgi:hypothetical protein